MNERTDALAAFFLLSQCALTVSGGAFLPSKMGFCAFLDKQAIFVAFAGTMLVYFIGRVTL